MARCFHFYKRCQKKKCEISSRNEQADKQASKVLLVGHMRSPNFSTNETIESGIRTEVAVDSGAS